MSEMNGNAQGTLEPGVLERLKRWRDVGDGPISYCAGGMDFAEDVVKLITAFDAAQPPAAPVETMSLEQAGRIVHKLHAERDEAIKQALELEKEVAELRRQIARRNAESKRSCRPSAETNEDRDYVCLILGTCPHWLAKCFDLGCQHLEAIAMRNGSSK